jgi:hypothetical protein
VSSSSAMQMQKSVLEDFQVKLVAFGGLLDALSKSETDKLGCATGVVKVLGVTQSTWGDDEFAKAWDAYSKEVVPKAKDFSDKYARFKAWVDGEIRTGKATRSVKGVDAVIELLRTDRAAADAHRHQTPYMSEKERSRYDYGTSAETKYQPYGKRVRRHMARLAGSEVRAMLSVGEDGRAAYDEIKKKVDAAIRDLDAATSSRSYSSDIGAFIDAGFEPVMSALDELRAKLVAEESSNRSDVFNLKNSTPENFLTYNKSSDRFRAAADAASGERNFAFEDVDIFENALSVPQAYARLGGPLSKMMSDADAQVKNVLRSVPPASKDPEHERRRKELATVMDAIVSMADKMGMAAMGNKKPAEIGTLVTALAGVRNIRGVGKTVRAGAHKGGLFSSSSGHGASSSGYGSPGSGGQEEEAAKAGDGFMYRRVDKGRVARYKDQLSAFADAIADSKLGEHVTNAAGRLRKRLAELDKVVADAKAGDSVLLDEKRTSANTARVEAARTFCDMSRKFIVTYVAAHKDFVGKRQREALEYMEYWRAKKDIIPDPEAVAGIDGFDEKRKEVAVNAIEVLTKDVRPKIAGELEACVDGLDNDDSAKVVEMFETMLVYTTEQADKVGKLWSNGAPTVVDNLLDPHFIVMYLLKGFRLVSAWYALRTGGAVFQGMYDSRVYARDEQPPSPAVFVGIFLLMDLAINLVLGVALVFAKHMFKRMDNDFPVDSSLLTAWAFDYAISTAVVAVMALIIGEIIRKKKYFRYKYEGDRGIRAMRQMVMNVYCVILFVPFFRLAHG